MKKICLIILTSTLFFICSACGQDVDKVKMKAEEEITVFSTNDIEKINDVIFDMKEFIPGDEMEDQLDKNQKEQDSEILRYIFERNEISVNKVHKETVEYKIKTPNIEHIFQELKNNQSKMSNEELRQYFVEYIKKTQIKTFIAQVPYQIKDDQVKINYQCESFINAITGGLLNAYKDMYKEMLSEYAEGIKRK